MENIISVLLDLEGTSDKITEETAELGFADEGDYIKILFYIKCFLVDKQFEIEEIKRTLKL